MHIDAITTNPAALQAAVDKAIKEGKLKTWRKLLNSKGETLYSHIPDQWDERAMPKPLISKEKLRFKIVWYSKNEEPNQATKGYITGRFSEILLVHFSDYFTRLETFSK